MTGSDSLPTTWAETRLEDVAEIILGQSPPGLSYNTDGIGLPFFQGSAEFGDLYPEIKKWTTKPTKFARAGDVLLSVRAPVGPTNLAPLDCAIGRGVAAIRAVDEIMPKYLLYALRATESALATASPPAVRISRTTFSAAVSSPASPFSATPRSFTTTAAPSPRLIPARPPSKGRQPAESTNSKE